MINYPNKKVINNKDNNKISLEEINKSSKDNFIYANRGMDFEKAITLSCEYYEDNKIALLSKRPTPIKILKTDYKKCRIKDGIFEKQSNTDYNGIYKAKYIDFECKETKSTTSLSFYNIPSHQIEHLKKVNYFGGIAFFLIYFKTLNEIYLLDSNIIINEYEKGVRHSIEYKVIKEKGHLIKEGYAPRINFIDAVEKEYFSK